MAKVVATLAAAAQVVGAEPGRGFVLGGVVDDAVYCLSAISTSGDVDADMTMLQAAVPAPLGVVGWFAREGSMDKEIKALQSKSLVVPGPGLVKLSVDSTSGEASADVGGSTVACTMCSTEGLAPELGPLARATRLALTRVVDADANMQAALSSGAPLAFVVQHGRGEQQQATLFGEGDGDEEGAGCAAMLGGGAGGSGAGGSASASRSAKKAKKQQQQQQGQGQGDVVTEREMVHAQLVHNVSASAASSSDGNGNGKDNGAAPSLMITKQTGTPTPTVTLTAIAYVSEETSTAEAARRLARALRAQWLLAQHLPAPAQQGEAKTVAVFALPGYAHHLVLGFTADEACRQGTGEEKSLLEQRRTLHTRMALPTDRPLLRLACALDLRPVAAGKQQRDKKQSLHLINVHKGLPPSGVEHGTLSLVQGDYAYYHYLQDGFNDDGWGCAYRSFQTIFSWFRLQHYTNKPIPTHMDIQNMLVHDLQDKEEKFIGSKQWIGAFEINLMLDHLLNVPCKIMNVNSGGELEGKGRELAKHFETNGTPVMIGGGVLAYTLIGIDFNNETGDIKFLILDPHYTGADELGNIQKKKWIAWHASDLFLKSAFYNLCMPQRPTMI